MNYELMSDFEINKAVAGKVLDYYECDGSKVIGHIKRSGVLNVSTVFNPCNNPADAWPIIIENKISVEYSIAESGWLAHCTNFIVTKLVSGIGYEFESTHENPLRAAMIVFLMMNEK